MTALSVAIVVAAALAHDGFKRWLKREQDARLAKVDAALERIRAEVASHEDGARRVRDGLSQVGIDFAKMDKRIGDLEKQLIARRAM